MICIGWPLPPCLWPQSILRCNAISTDKNGSASKRAPPCQTEREYMSKRSPPSAKYKGFASLTSFARASEKADSPKHARCASCRNKASRVLEGGDKDHDHKDVSRTEFASKKLRFAQAPRELGARHKKAHYRQAGSPVSYSQDQVNGYALALTA